jgi:hypothetical protein
VVDRKSGKQVVNWPVDKDGNFVMAIDRDRNQLLVAFHSPAQHAVLAMAGGNLSQPRRARQFVSNSRAAKFQIALEADSSRNLHLIVFNIWNRNFSALSVSEAKA